MWSESWWARAPQVGGHNIIASALTQEALGCLQEMSDKGILRMFGYWSLADDFGDALVVSKG